mmetsp:Transcript_9139/g.25556  ORF Transcript_9139/g.25556 Transcript_9139/m.25556 type:complete len:200 (-) Transcript_9139:113-712(-)
MTVTPARGGGLQAEGHTSRLLPAPLASAPCTHLLRWAAGRPAGRKRLLINLNLALLDALEPPRVIAHREPVDSVALVVLRAALAVEDVSKVAAAVVADDLDGSAFALHPDMAAMLLGVDHLVEARPTATRLELGICGVQGEIASCALEEAVLGVHLVVLVTPRPLGATLPEYSVLLRAQDLLPLRLTLLDFEAPGSACG